MASRHRSRELAMQMLYQFEMDPKGLESPVVIDRFWSEQANASDDTREYFEHLVKGTARHMPEIDTLIQSVLENWKLTRIEKVDLALLRISVFELSFDKELSPAIVINEALEIGKRFGNQNSPTFINGILDAIAKKPKEAKIKA